MKKQKKYILVVLTVLSVLLGNICIGQSTDAEIVYYNNPDIISNRFTEQDVSREPGKDSQKVKDGFDSNVGLREPVKLVFAEVEEAKIILSAKDDFIKSLSPFDKSARLKTDRFVSDEEFLEFAANQVRPWTVGEKVRFRVVIKSAANRLKEYNLNFPPKILLIKTSGLEEGGTAYCRQNAIFLPEKMLAQQNASLEKMLIHELFHILSANNPKLRENLYEMINFKKCNDIELPEKMREIKITNPDGLKNDHYVEVEYKGSIVIVVPILYSSAQKYNVEKGGEFFRYLKMSLLVIEKDGDVFRYKRDDNGEPVLLDVRDVPGISDKIGENTDYLIHPDEVLAENFVLMVQGNQQVRSKWVIEKMEKVFKKEARKGYGIN